MIKYEVYKENHIEAPKGNTSWTVDEEKIKANEEEIDILEDY